MITVFPVIVMVGGVIVMMAAIWVAGEHRSLNLLVWGWGIGAAVLAAGILLTRRDLGSVKAALDARWKKIRAKRERRRGRKPRTASYAKQAEKRRT